MDVLQLIRGLWAHCTWAGEALFEAMKARVEVRTAWHEYAHVLGAEEVWLARLEQRQALVAVWPTLSADEARTLRRDVVAGYDAYLARLNVDSLARNLEYRNSAGQLFSTATVDILLHVALHGQYHRGKINLLLREAGLEPAPVDYIRYVRGAVARS